MPVDPQPVGTPQVLDQDPENLAAHFNLALVYADLGDTARAEAHRALVDKYRPDDHAVEQAVATHRRRNPAADHAAEPVAVYDLQRPQAYGLPAPAQYAGGRPDATAAAGVGDARGT